MCMICFSGRPDDLARTLTKQQMLNIPLRFTLDASADFTLGTSLESLQRPLNELGACFERCRHTQTLMELSVPFQFLVPKRQYYRDLDYIETFLDPIITETINHLSDKTDTEKPNRKDRGYTMLHACAEVSTDPRFLRDELITAMFAGRDNVAMALTWTLYELSRNPDVVVKLRETIQTTIGFDRKPTYEDMKSMKMLSNIFSETLRLYPGVPINMRMCAKDTSLPRGGGTDGNSPIGVLAGTNVIYSSHMLRMSTSDRSQSYNAKS